jgi:transposase
MSPLNDSNQRGEEERHMGHSIELREKVIETALTGSQRQWEVAEKYGIGLSTLQKWLKEYRAGGDMPMGRKKEKRPQDWSGQERLNALLETAGMSEEQLGGWCRRHGLHTHHLEKWKEEAVSGKMGKQDTTAQAELKRLREENKQLQKELRRKDKALAETSALLVLKKKANAIWGDGEDD